ncbi:TPA: hypothetical protein HA253_04195 [Candidatus Woesearchaeota archaeon]|nr:hypothetical protein [Candidatus Woesearchaeota archaeon]
MDAVIERISSILENASTPRRGTCTLPDKTIFPIDQTFFKALPKADGNQVCACIDGGNQELIASPHLAVQYIRVVGVVFQGKRKQEMMKEEFFVVLSREGSRVRADCFPDPFTLSGDYSSSAQKAQKTQKEATLTSSCSLSSIALDIRRAAEVRMGGTLIKTGFQGSIIVDGALDDHLCSIDLPKDVSLMALSKTTDLISDEGISVVALLHSIAPPGSWCFVPPGVPGSLSFVRLHPLSRHIFRVETKGNASLAPLVYHAQDPAFLGYPYGLIIADKFARVTDQEKTYLRSILDARVFLGRTRSILDAHSHLDAVNGPLQGKR